MTTCYLAPDPIQSTFFIPGGNTPANGGQLFFYVAGSSTKQTVYKDNAAATAWTNPIVLDSGGNLPSGGEVWFPTGQTFKVIFAPSTDTDPPASPYWTKDNLSGINDVGTQTGSEWVSGPAPTYISGTQFVLSGDQSATFTAGRRLKTTNTGGTIYSTIQNAVFSAASTTVNVVSDSGSLDSGLSAVSYGIADPANPSISPVEVNRKGAAVASAGNGTTNIWGTIGDYVHITGTNSIYNFSTAPYAGASRDLVFDGALTLFSSASMTIVGGSNVSTVPGDTARVRADTVSTFVFTNYQSTSGTYPAPQSSSTVFAGPSSGVAARPSFRSLVGAEASLSLIAVKTYSSVSTVSFTTSDLSWTAFDRYRFDIINLQPSVSSSLYFLISTDGGATFLSAASSYTQAGPAYDSNNVQQALSFLGPQWVLNPTTLSISSSSVFSYQGSVTLVSPTIARRKSILFDFAFNESVSGNYVSGCGGGNCTTTISVNGAQLKISAGNMSGTTYVYGIRSA